MKAKVQQEQTEGTESGFIFLLCFLSCLLFNSPAQAQFRRSSDSNAYPWATSIANADAFIIYQVSGTTNKNYSGTNLNTLITNTAAYQVQIGTNNYAPVVTQIVNYVVTQNFNGNQITNLNGQNVRYPTNQGSTVSMDVGNKYTGLTTNNNVAITACANVDSTGTNISWGILTVTNSAGSGAVKTIAIPAAWVDVDNLGGTTIYNTNQGVLSVMVYPGLGTNFIWRGK